MEKKKTDFTQLSNSEINLKLKGFENEYITKRDKIVKLVHELQELDEIYNEGKAELNKRGLLD